MPIWLCLVPSTTGSRWFFHQVDTFEHFFLILSGARHDLTLIEELRKLRAYKKDIAEATLRVMDPHTNYLG